MGQVKEKLKKGYQYPVIGYMLGFGSEIRGERRKLLLIIFIKMVDYLKKALIYGHTSRISS